MPHNVFLTFESVDEVLRCYYSPINYGAVISCMLSYILYYDLLRCASCLLLLSPFNKILLCNHSDESSNTSCGVDLIERHCLCGERLERERERERVATSVEVK